MDNSTFTPLLHGMFWHKGQASSIDAALGELYVLSDDDGLCGVLFALYMPSMTNGSLTAMEYAWFVLPEKRRHGIRLMDFYIKRAKEKGCKLIVMCHMADQPETLKKLYKRKGFVETESNYTLFVGE